MDFKSAQCPSCAAQLQLPDDKGKLKCNYCGSDIVVKEAISLAAKIGLASARELAKIALDAGNYDDAKRHVDKILYADSNDADAWFLKALVLFGKAKSLSVGEFAAPQTAIKFYAKVLGARK